MFDNTLVIVIIAVLASIALYKIGSLILSARKSNPEDNFEGAFGSAWPAIRPIISELIVELVNIYQAGKTDFDGLLEYSVGYIKRRIEDLDMLSETEKEMFTKDLIRELIRPRLKELYERKLK